MAALTTVVLGLAQPAAAQAPTTQDLQAMEARILNAIHRDTANTTTTINALKANLTSLKTQVQALNTSFATFVAANNLTANRTWLGTITAMRLSLAAIHANLTELDAYALAEHKKIYGALVETRENATTHKPEQVPLLPAIKRAVEGGTLAVQGDIGEWAANMTVAVEELDYGTAAAIQVSDNTNGKTNFMMVATTVTLAAGMATLSYVTKRPRRMYRRYAHEARKVAALGRQEAPPCEAPPEMDLAFGDWATCPPSVRDACSVSTICLGAARAAEDKRILEDEEVRRRAAELEAENPTTPAPAPSVNGNGNGHRGAVVVAEIPEEV